ncbi:MAG: DUF3800 domain-containing protein [Thermoplasmata archaeon]|nr:DUF3800 domain-containing protein [Thermoplasmata archaeon]MBE6523910.1 DUF3800 domain-containing protein [Thermoplasmata archaeon]
MTWVVAIDESGDLGKDSRFFSMAAVINERVRNLEPVFKKIPKIREDSKFYNSTESEIIDVLASLPDSDSIIISVTVDKHDYTGSHYGVHGNKLYAAVLGDLFDSVFEHIGAHDVSVFLDRSTFVTILELNSICLEAASHHGTNVKKCVKATSHQNRCVQIADFAAGAINRKFEYDDIRFYGLIEKISFARKH